MTDRVFELVQIGALVVVLVVLTGCSDANTVRSDGQCGECDAGTACPDGRCGPCDACPDARCEACDASDSVPDAHDATDSGDAESILRV